MNIRKFFEAFENGNPDPQIELNHSNPFTLLVAVVLSANSTDKMVNRCTDELFKVCTTPQQMLDLGEEALKHYIKRILFANNKARHLIKTVEILVNQYNGEVPGDFNQLVKLPGIGRKSADVILNTCFGKPTIAVDRHIFRVYHTIGISKQKAKTTDDVADILTKITPLKYKKKAHHWLVLHGRYICTARKKHCDKCPVSTFCKTYKSNQKNITNTTQNQVNTNKVGIKCKANCKRQKELQNK